MARAAKRMTPATGNMQPDLIGRRIYRWCPRRGRWHHGFVLDRSVTQDDEGRKYEAVAIRWPGTNRFTFVWPLHAIHVGKHAPVKGKNLWVKPQ